MKALISKLYYNSVIRYVFFGGLTTLVNLVSYYFIRRLTPLNIPVSNVISISLAILFAFFTNSRYVFESKAQGMREHFHEFVKFVSARLSTMVIEVGGVSLLAWIGMNDMIAKFLTQFIVLALNYIFSKFIVFTKKE